MRSTFHPIIVRKVEPGDLDEAIAALAGAQHGVVAHRQLAALGLAPRAIQYRLTHGRLPRLHRGVYAVGHEALRREARGWRRPSSPSRRAEPPLRRGALGHPRGDRARTEITVPRALKRRDRLEIHRAGLPADEVTVERRIPVTTPARTLLDLAASSRRSTSNGRRPRRRSAASAAPPPSPTSSRGTRAARGPPPSSDSSNAATSAATSPSGSSNCASSPSSTPTASPGRTSTQESTAKRSTASGPTSTSSSSSTASPPTAHGRPSKPTAPAIARSSSPATASSASRGAS